MTNVFVKPQEGGRVRMPERGGKVMSAEGQLVPRNDYYERLLLAGDVVEDKDPKAQLPEQEKPEPIADGSVPSGLKPPLRNTGRQ